MDTDQAAWRPKIAVWAYACDPARGSDPGATWGYVNALAVHADLIVLHSPEDAEGLTTWKRQHPGAPIEFLEVPEPSWGAIVRRAFKWHRQLQFINYVAWLRGALATTRRLQVLEPLDAVAHASYGNYWLPSPLRKIGLPSILGPVGGGVRTPLLLWPTLGVSGVIAELERSGGLSLAARLPGTRSTQRHATVIVVETEETRKRLRRARRGDAVVVNRAAIIQAQTASADLELDLPDADTGPGEFLFTSALWGKKGPRLALSALRYADPRVRLAFVNDGYEQRRLEELAQRWGVVDRVRFLGRIPRDEMFAHMQAATGLVFTGLREEGGVALAEAMHQGLPVVVLAHGGAGQIAGHTPDLDRVKLVKPGTPRTTARRLGQAMSELLVQAPEDRSSTLNARQHLDGVASAVTRALSTEAPTERRLDPEARRPRVTIVQRVIRHYRIPFFEALRAELDERGIELSVVYSTPPPERDRRNDIATLSWGRLIGARDVGFNNWTMLWQQAPRSLWQSDLVVVEQATQLLLNYRLLARRYLRGPKVAFWGHGTSPYPDANVLSESVKRLVSRRPDWWFAYTDGVADRVASFGFPRQRVTSVRNATDTRDLSARVDGVTEADLAELRAEIGLRGHNVGMFVGALVREKELERLVDAADIIRSEVSDFELLIAGGGPLGSWVADQAKRRPWMHFLGQRYGDDLASALLLSSVMTIPAWVGLVIVDGFAAGRPIVASAASPHPPEIDYLRHGHNGLLLDDDGDARGYADGVVAALRDPELIRRLQHGAREDAAHFTAEQMARRFADGIVQALAAPPRRS